MGKHLDARLRRRPSRGRVSRRRLLQTLGGAALAAPFYGLLRPGAARADGNAAKRVIFFYYPDGVPAGSQNGDLTKWHAWGSEHDFSLGECMQPLEAWRDRCVFLNGLSMGGTDAGSHPGGAKKLLTAADHAGGESIDQYLARTVGANNYWRHLYLGVQANHNNASGDKHISYPTAGASIAPEDNPRRAFELLFGSAPPPPQDSGDDDDDSTEEITPDPTEVSVIDGVLDEMNALRSRLGTTEGVKLDIHLEALREVEQRIKYVPGSGGNTGGANTGGGSTDLDCGAPSIDTGAFSDGQLYDAEKFGDILRAQTDLMVLAMACGLTRVGTLQCSHHTSELVMSRIPGSPMHDPTYDMRSHQASHYGASHDWESREFTAFFQQRQWFASQFAYLLERLGSIPDGDGTMLDSSVVVLTTEVCDGNTHAHDNMPFVVAGGACGRINTGRFLDVGYRRHGDLWVSVANAMGDGTSWFGDSSAGAVPGLVS